jgi:ubiquitin C-terminal hydrolase
MRGYAALALACATAVQAACVTLTMMVVSRQTDDGLQYQLSGVVVHTGRTISRGHYFSFVRSTSRSAGQPDKWYRKNDSEVRAAACWPLCCHSS